MKRQLVFAIFPLFLAGCAGLQESIPFLSGRAARVGGVYRENLGEERLVDLTMVKKISGDKTLGVFPAYTQFLEGYIRGIVVDYEDNPIEGVVVRVTAQGKDLPGFDAGISDANGVYRIRFAQPVRKGRLDIQGAITYNPGWIQQYELTSNALEPQTKETKFRLFYDQRTGFIAISEDMPKTIVRKATGVPKDVRGEERRNRVVERKPPPGATPPASLPKKNQDFFGGFGDFKP